MMTKSNALFARIIVQLENAELKLMDRVAAIGRLPPRSLRRRYAVRYSELRAERSIHEALLAVAAEMRVDRGIPK